MDQQAFTTEGIKALRQQERFEEIVVLVASKWGQADLESSVALGFEYAYALYRLNRYQEALRFCRILYRRSPESTSIRHLYAWTIFRLVIQPGAIKNRKRFIQAALAVVSLTRQEEAKTPYEKTVFRVLSVLKDPFMPRDILRWLDRLDSSLLSTESPADGGTGKQKASPLELYYSYRSESLLRLGSYHECIDVCQRALNEIPRFHYRNDIWFKRRIARSYFGVGEFENALELLKSLLQTPEDWFIRKECAQVNVELGDIKCALRYGLDAALQYGSPAHRINLYVFLATLFDETGHLRLASCHWRLVYAIKREQNWFIDAALSERIKGLSSVKTDTVHSVYQGLQPLWERIRFWRQTRHTGVLVRWTAGEGGVLATDLGHSLHVGLWALRVLPSFYQEGTEMEFYLDEDAPDRQAIAVRPVTADPDREVQ